MEELVSHWAGCHEILNFSIFQKSIEKIQLALKSDKAYVQL